MSKFNAGKASLFAITAVFAVSAFFLGKSLVTPVSADRPETVTICHATASNVNPYNVQHPAKSSDVSGHDGHNGPVWFDGIQGDWGDIIPPFDYNGGSYLGKNWTTEGQGFYNNDCNAPDSDEEPVWGCTDSQANNFDFQATDDDGSCTYDEPTTAPTATPNGDVCLNLDGIQTSVPEGLHLSGAYNNQCVSFSQPGVPTPPPATGQVLGATTMAKTGSFDEALYLAIMGLGATLTAIGTKKAFKKA